MLDAIGCMRQSREVFRGVIGIDGGELVVDWGETCPSDEMFP